jgi:imidazolonepropionase-like amidohydrolase
MDGRAGGAVHRRHRRGVTRFGLDNFAGALELYSWLGFPHDRVIEFATVNAAAALGLGAVTGRLAPGLAADLLIVEGDPLTTLDALHKVRMVMAAGTLHPPSSAAPRM